MPDEHGTPIEKLIERWIGGDKSAAEEIYQRYYRRAWRFGLRLTGREADADDIAQQALASGLEGIRGGVRPDKFTGWILGIARHAALRKWDKDQRELGDSVEDVPLPPASGPATKLIGQEMAGLMQRVLGKLDPKDRELLRLRLEKKIQRKQAAAMLGLPETSLDRNMDRLLACLRQELSRHFTTLVLPQAIVAGKQPVTLRAVARLRPSFRRVFELCRLEGLPLKEVAIRMGVPVATIEARLRIAYEELGCRPDDDFAQARAEYRAGKQP